MKNRFLSIAITLIAILMVNVATAQSPHIVKKGSSSSIVGNHVTFIGDLAGLGSLGSSGTADVQLFADVSFKVTCYNNPQNTAVGQSGESALLESPVITYTIDKNGRISITSPGLATEDATGSCRGAALTAVVSNLKVNSAYLSINNGQYILQLSVQ